TFTPARQFPRYLTSMRANLLPPGRPVLEVRRKGQTEEKGNFVARGERIVMDLDSVAGLLVSSGDIRLNKRSSTGSAFILAGGTVELGFGGDLVLVCDGDVEAARGLVSC